MRKGEEAYMEYKLNREAITVNEVVFDASQEQPIDLDLSLPDDCPDIQKIMKCQVYPCITAKSILGDCLEVSGTATMRLLYLDAGGTQIRCYENATQFFRYHSTETQCGKCFGLHPYASGICELPRYQPSPPGHSRSIFHLCQGGGAGGKPSALQH